MFTELTEELLDLQTSVKGGVVPYAAAADDTGCSSSCGTVVLCCSLCHICW
jgi:hypothetical protein